MILTENTNNLSKGSHTLIYCKCDICGVEKNMEYRTYYKNTKNLTELYYCHKCSRIKTEKTNLEKYGGKSPCNNQEILNKIKNNNIIKYGVEYPSQLENVKDKQANTNLEKYGTKSVLQNKQYFQKGKNTMILKYGVEFPIQNDELKEQIKKTLLKNIGKDNALKNREKIKETFLNKYGYKNPMQSKEVIDKANSTKRKKLLLKYNIPNLDYNIDKKVFIYKCDKGHLAEIPYYVFHNRIKLNSILCTECYPVNSYSNSGYEIQLRDFISENYNGEIVSNSRNVINKTELDIYIPDLKMAFEFNGLFWHSEYNLPKDYHISKTESCEKNGISLIQIYEDDWLYKNDIVKSRILNLLGKSTKIYARKCEVREVKENDLIKKFLDKNHIQGFVGSKYKIGLYFNDELYGLMTFGSLRRAMGKKNIKNQYELLRYCTKINTTIIGGASRLFNYFLKKYNPEKITSYADRSWSRGLLYEKLGFTLHHKTSPNYYYIINGIRKYRFNFRKDKLISEGFDSNKTEHEIMLDRKIYRIYDSGNLVYTYMNTLI